MTEIGTSLLVQWWTPVPGSEEFAGESMECADADELKHRLGEIARQEPWMGLVRIVALVGGRPSGEASTDLDGVRSWDPGDTMLPADRPDIELPPRGRRELRYDVVLGCREQLARGVRARLLEREDVGLLLLAIDRAFDRSPTLDQR